MRNLVKHPITVSEIVSYLNRLELDALAEEKVGDMRPLLLSMAAKIVRAHPELPVVWSLTEPETSDIERAHGERADHIERCAREALFTMPHQRRMAMMLVVGWSAVEEELVRAVVDDPAGCSEEDVVRAVIRNRFSDPAEGYVPYA